MVICLDIPTNGGYGKGVGNDFRLVTEGVPMEARATKDQALEAARRGLIVSLWDGPHCVFSAWPSPSHRAADPLQVWLGLFPPESWLWS